MAKTQAESLNSKNLSLVKKLVTKPNLLLQDSIVYNSKQHTYFHFIKRKGKMPKYTVVPEGTKSQNQSL